MSIAVGAPISTLDRQVILRRYFLLHHDFKGAVPCAREWGACSGVFGNRRGIYPDATRRWVPARVAHSILRGGTLKASIFLDQALGAAYTPRAIGPDGKIYTENKGSLFVIGQ